jgi:hypothetical protein
LSQFGRQKEYVASTYTMPRFKFNCLEGSDKMKTYTWLKSVFETETLVLVGENSSLEDECEFNNKKQKRFLIITKNNYY